MIKFETADTILGKDLCVYRTKALKLSFCTHIWDETFNIFV